MLNKDDYITIISSESAHGHKHTVQYKRGKTLLSCNHLQREGKGCCRVGRGGGARRWLSATSVLFDPGATLATGQSLLWAVLICVGRGCLPGGSVAAGDYRGQGHPPFSLPRTSLSDGQGKGWGRNSRSLAARADMEGGILSVSPAACHPGSHQILTTAAHMSHLTPQRCQSPAKWELYNRWSWKLHFQYSSFLPDLFFYINMCIYIYMHI